MSVSAPVDLMARGLALLAFMTAATAGAAGATVDFDRLSIEQGLSQSIVEQILQDRVGFMWFVTEDGLNRFDGYRFTVYRNEAGNPESLSHNELKAVHEAADGMLWVGVFAGGLNRLDPTTGRVQRYLHDPADPDSLAGDTVRAVLEGSDGALWVGTQGEGLDRLDRASGRFVHYPPDPADPDALPNGDVRVLVEDAAGALWVGTHGGGLVRLDRTRGRFERFRHDPEDPASLSHDTVHAVLEDSDGTLWVGTDAGLDRLERASGRFTHHHLGSPASGPEIVRALCEDHKGSLWVGIDGGGLARLDRSSGHTDVFRHDPLDPHSLSTDRVWSLAQDRSRVLWVGTYGGGLNSYDVSRKSFRRISHAPDDPGSLGHDIVWSFWEEPDGTLWVGTDAGLDRRNPESGRFDHFRHDSASPGSLAHDTVRALVGTGDGQLWVATNGGGLDLYNPADGRFRHHRHDPNDPGSLAHNDLRGLTLDRRGRLWISTFGAGLDRLDPGSSTFQHYRHDPAEPAGLGSNFVRFVVEDPSGDLWVGTQGGGLDRLDPETGRAVHYRHDPAEPASLASDHVFALQLAGDSSLWVGTFNGGLDHLDLETGRAEHFTAADGLASNGVYAMLADDDGGLWISTTRGLSRFTPADWTCRSYDVRDGLQANEFNGGAALRRANGELLFGGIGGYNAFFADEIRSNPVAPRVVLTELLLFNRPVCPGATEDGRVLLERSITFTDRLRLSHRDTVVSFEFAALHYSAPEKNRYRYQLEGFSDAWISVGADRRFATFTGLAPGRYRFRVLGSNADGLWDERGATLDLTVTPPFWATWWFRGTGLLAGLAVAAVMLRTRVRTERLRTELRAAHDAQMAIMPQAPPDVAGFEVAGICLPAAEVGGDFYDHFWLEGQPRRLCLVVGDAAGKAMKAAMTAVMSDGMVYSRAGLGGSVEEIMGSLNRSLHAKLEPRMFTALCLMVLDPSSRALTFATAGLCEPLLVSGSGIDALTTPGAHLPLGALADTRYESRTVRLEPGDLLLVFSDGVPEARSPAGEPYGYDAPGRLLADLDLAYASAATIRDALVADVRRFTARHLTDDLAVLVVRATATKATDREA